MIAALVTLPRIATATATRDGAGLQDIAGRAGMLFGSAITAAELTRNGQLQDAAARHCGVLVPELELKWAWVEPKPGRPAFDAADTVARFAQAHGKRLHGHTLLWHDSVPAWAVGEIGGANGWALVERHIDRTMRHFDGIQTWDVVNEPLAPDTASENLRPSPFLQAFGPDYVGRAFRAARDAAPHALLFLNEYGVEYETVEAQHKRRALLGLIDRLLAQRVPIDGVGIQAHLDLAKRDMFGDAAFAAFLNEIGGRGLRIRISELDVKEADRTPPQEERDRAVADMARRFLDVALDNRAVGDVVCWGLSDRFSWLNGPGTINRGLPLDAAYAPKALYQVLADRFERRALTVAAT